MWAIELAQHQPPRNTRAFGRGEVIRYLAGQSLPGMPDLEGQSGRDPPYVINWSVFQIRGGSAFLMPDPFRTYVHAVREHIRQ